MSISPDNSSLAAIYDTGKIALYSVPNLILKNSWPIVEQVSFMRFKSVLSFHVITYFHVYSLYTMKQTLKYLKIQHKLNYLKKFIQNLIIVHVILDGGMIM